MSLQNNVTHGTDKIVRDKFDLPRTKGLNVDFSWEITDSDKVKHVGDFLANTDYYLKLQIDLECCESDLSEPSHEISEFIGVLIVIPNCANTTIKNKMVMFEFSNLGIQEQYYKFSLNENVTASNFFGEIQMFHKAHLIFSELL